MAEFIEYGYWGLFLSSFLAATILPFSSEAILSLCVYSGYDISLTVAIASLGNWLGGLTGYCLGYLGKLEKIEKWLRIKPEKAIRAREYLRKRGNAFAFFAFLPFIGDLIPIGLGLLRTNPYWMALFMAAGKACRYIVWAWLTLHAMA
ncbi:YqaA family protein [Marinifilum caeruleilacunae]|uniref:DedA family protein n=1 Tax=Marinifilum caeruleilacunae TaxID=2499076 RepID=A0ABX1X0W5_9BACT|nr:YqaA family protein [Marinifilum caeruleilacunae]NOU62054.1 DedA family protein [Marinifilum caeruleilacunae]